MIIAVPAAAQSKLAVLAPEKSALDERYAARLADAFAGRCKVLDASMSEAAYRAVGVEKPFNLTTEEARTAGAALGADFFLLVRAHVTARFSFAKKDYFEAYAVVYAASALSGRLVAWRLAGFEAARREEAEAKLFAGADALAADLAAAIALARAREKTEAPAPPLAEIPAEGSPEAKDFRPPLPYRRIPPAYTALADFYRVEATVDIEVDFDAGGRVTRAEIVRWAGFGLDESVAETVRRMNWRPAERGGQPAPVRALLRYNFRKIEKEDL